MDGFHKDEERVRNSVILNLAYKDNVEETFNSNGGKGNNDNDDISNLQEVASRNLGLESCQQHINNNIIIDKSSDENMNNVERISTHTILGVGVITQETSSETDQSQSNQCEKDAVASEYGCDDNMDEDDNVNNNNNNTADDDINVDCNRHAMFSSFVAKDAATFIDKIEVEETVESDCSKTKTQICVSDSCNVTCKDKKENSTQFNSGNDVFDGHNEIMTKCVAHFRHNGNEIEAGDAQHNNVWQCDFDNVAKQESIIITDALERFSDSDQIDCFYEDTAVDVEINKNKEINKNEQCSSDGASACWKSDSSDHTVKNGNTTKTQESNIDNMDSCVVIDSKKMSKETDDPEHFLITDDSIHGDDDMGVICNDTVMAAGNCLNVGHCREDSFCNMKNGKEENNDLDHVITGDRINNHASVVNNRDGESYCEVVTPTRYNDNDGDELNEMTVLLENPSGIDDFMETVKTNCFRNDELVKMVESKEEIEDPCGVIDNNEDENGNNSEMAENTDRDIDLDDSMRENDRGLNDRSSEILYGKDKEFEITQNDPSCPDNVGFTRDENQEVDISISKMKDAGNLYCNEEDSHNIELAGGETIITKTSFYPERENCELEFGLMKKINVEDTDNSCRWQESGDTNASFFGMKDRNNSGDVGGSCVDVAADVEVDSVEVNKGVQDNELYEENVNENKNYIKTSYDQCVSKQQPTITINDANGNCIKEENNYFWDEYVSERLPIAVDDTHDKENKKSKHDPGEQSATRCLTKQHGKHSHTDVCMMDVMAAKEGSIDLNETFLFCNLNNKERKQDVVIECVNKTKVGHTDFSPLMSSSENYSTDADESLSGEIDGKEIAFGQEPVRTETEYFGSFEESEITLYFDEEEENQHSQNENDKIIIQHCLKTRPIEQLSTIFEKGEDCMECDDWLGEETGNDKSDQCVSFVSQCLSDKERQNTKRAFTDNKMTTTRHEHRPPSPHHGIETNVITRMGDNKMAVSDIRTDGSDVVDNRLRTLIIGNEENNGNDACYHGDQIPAGNTLADVDSEGKLCCDTVRETLQQSLSLGEQSNVFSFSLLSESGDVINNSSGSCDGCNSFEEEEEILDNARSRMNIQIGCESEREAKVACDEMGADEGFDQFNGSQSKDIHRNDDGDPRDQSGNEFVGISSDLSSLPIMAPECSAIDDSIQLYGSQRLIDSLGSNSSSSITSDVINNADIPYEQNNHSTELEPELPSISSSPQRTSPNRPVENSSSTADSGSQLSTDPVDPSPSFSITSDLTNETSFTNIDEGTDIFVFEQSSRNSDLKLKLRSHSPSSQDVTPLKEVILNDNSFPDTDSGFQSSSDPCDPNSSFINASDPCDPNSSFINASDPCDSNSSFINASDLTNEMTIIDDEDANIFKSGQNNHNDDLKLKVHSVSPSPQNVISPKGLISSADTSITDTDSDSRVSTDPSFPSSSSSITSDVTEPSFDDFDHITTSVTFSKTSNNTKDAMDSTSACSEDYIMDQLFFACDRQNTGRVRVLDLIDYLGNIMGIPLEDDDAVNRLIALLDPDNINAEIDIGMYRNGFYQWIQTINKHEHLQHTVGSPVSRSSSKECIPESSVMSGRMNDVLVYQAWDNANERTALSNQLMDLQMENRKLIQDNTEVHALLDARDEDLARLTREMIEQDVKYKRLQDTINAFAKVEEDKAELARQLCSCQENYEDVLDRNKQLNQEKALLHVQLSRFKKQVKTSTVDLSACRYEKECLEQSLLESKEKACRNRETINNLEIQLSGKDEAVEELRSCLQQSCLNIKDLEHRNKEIETQLAEAQEELASVYNRQSDQSCSFTGQGLPGLRELRDFIEEDVIEQSTSHSNNTGTISPPSSIHNEFKELLSSCPPDRPWPLSEKEIVEGTATERNKQQTNITNIEHSQQPKISSCNSQDRHSPMEEKSHCEISNERLRWLVSFMKKVKGENDMYRRVLTQLLSNKLYSNSVISSHDDTDSSHCGDTRGGGKPLQPSLPLNQLSDNTMSSQRKEYIRHGVSYSQFERPIDRDESSWFDGDIALVVEENKKLRNDIVKLRRYNVDLAEKFHLTELKVQSLEEEAEDITLALQREKQRYVELEETLCETTLSRQLDLRDIWRLVQKDVETETEHYTEGYEGFDPNSIEELKESIQENITALRRFKKNALALQERGQWTQCQGCNQDNDASCCCSQAATPTSPLIEALSIDAINGNLLPYNSSPRGLDNVCPIHHQNFDLKPRSLSLGNNSRSAASCPSLPTATFTFQPCHCLTSPVNNCHCSDGFKHLVNTECHHRPLYNNTRPVDATRSDKHHNNNNINNSNNHQHHDGLPLDNQSINNYCHCPVRGHTGLSSSNMSQLGSNSGTASNNNNVNQGRASPVHPPSSRQSPKPQSSTTKQKKSNPKTNASTGNTSRCDRANISTRPSSSAGNTKPKSQIGFIPIHKEPITCNKYQDPVKKPLPSGNSIPTGGLPLSGFKGVKYSHTGSTRHDGDKHVYFVTNKVRLDNWGDTSAELHKPSQLRQSHQPTEDVIEPSTATSVSKSSQSGSGGPINTATNLKARPKSLSWDTNNQQTCVISGRILGTSAAPSNPEILSNSHWGYHDQSISQQLSMESSSVDYDDYVDQSSCLQLYGVPEAMENWDLSPCMGQDGADLVGEEYHDSFLPRPMEVMSSSNEEEDSLNQVDIVGERNHSQDMNINSEQDGAEQHFRNTTGGQPYHGDVGVTQRMDTTTDANANVSMNANSRIPIVSATTTTQHTHGAPPPSASSMYQAQPSNTTVPLPSLPSGSSLPLPSLQSLHHHHQLSGLLRADNAAAVPARTTNNPANLTSFSNNLPIGTNNNISNSNTQMAMAFPPPPSSPDSLLSLSSSSSSSYSSIPSYYLKSGNSTLETSTASTCSKPTVMLSQGDNANRSSQEDNKSSTSTDTSTSTGSTCSFGAEGGGDESSRRTNELVPSSPPTSRHAFTADPQVAQPLPPNRLARIRQSHLANKRRGQMKNKTKLPEVSENSELETTSDQPSSEESSSTTTDQSPQDTSQMPTPHISITSEDNEDVVDEDCKVTPSIPDIFLNKLKVSSSSGLEQMSEKEIESKFVSLSLAFQTDKLTIDQRVSAQERARDLSEQNVDKELQGLGEAVEVLNQTITDCEVREIVQKIRRHINVLEQSAARVSSRAEVYGAVQQERRMCKAIEVMVQYTENLRRAREKEGTELQEARKILNERSLGAGLPGDYDTNPNRRSMSVGGFNVMGRPMRRRSEVVLPKVLGGVGSPSLTQTASMENVATVAPVIPTVTEREDASGVDSGGEDPRSRFQSAVASTTMKNAITNTIKRASLERLQSMTTTTITGTTTISASSSPRSSTVSQPSSLLLSSTSCPASVEGMNGRTPIRPDRISESSTESKDTKAGSGDEDAYRKGYEEGLKARLSQDLIELRDQQTTISSSLEDVMDRVDQAHEQDLALIERPSYFRTALLAIQRFIVFLMEYDYWSNKKVIRNFAGVLFVLMAIFAVFLSPPSSTIDLQHFSKPPQ